MPKKAKDYASILPITATIPPKKQAAKRHYGVHPYFTKRAWNVVAAYIENFTAKGDVVCDPFGGSGVTAIEALVLRREAIHIDINPWANFICEQIAISPVNLALFTKAFRSIELKCKGAIQALYSMNEEDLLSQTIPHWYPAKVRLPGNADVEYVEDLFTKKQLIGLSILRHHIDAISEEKVRNLLLLAFSATLNKCNRTFRSTSGRKASRGDSGIMAVYRYWVPPHPVELLTVAFRS